MMPPYWKSRVKPMEKTLRVMLVSALWAIALALMLIASLVRSDLDQRVCMGWALLAAMGASLIAVGHFIERSRDKVMDYLAHQDLRMTAAVNAALRNDRGPRSIR